MNFRPDRLYREAIGGVSFGYSYSVFFNSGGTEIYDAQGKQIARISPPLSIEEEARIKARERWTCSNCGEDCPTGHGICERCKRIGDD